MVHSCALSSSNLLITSMKSKNRKICDEVHYVVSWVLLGETQQWYNETDFKSTPDPEVIKLFQCSTQLSMKFFLLINVKMPTTVGILTFMSQKNSIIILSEPGKKLIFLIFFYLSAFKISCSAELSMKFFL